MTTRQTRERDKRAVMGLLGGSWDSALDGGDPERYLVLCVVVCPVVKRGVISCSWVLQFCLCCGALVRAALLF